MLAVYEFYVAERSRQLRFVPVACRSAHELVTRARELLERDSAEFVEVREGASVLFRLLN
ncbi:hypothetical protein [Phenylobacterium sp.]|uniref:hypothetical protein n=1 Tax=Phenylobacterium sp. TaxID=1871053 RepID=UPI002C5923EF|nr:hypothetical protein [Phenylobacterium sp.]HVI31020.1 hypothetical protein [Phenylobacterium sp.]